MWILISDLDSWRSKTHRKCFYLTFYVFLLWSYGKIKYQVAAILDFDTMAAPVIIVFGALKKLVQYDNIYICAKFHACRQIWTMVPLRAGTIRDLSANGSLTENVASGVKTVTWCLCPFPVFTFVSVSDVFACVSLNGLCLCPYYMSRRISPVCVLCLYHQSVFVSMSSVCVCVGVTCLFCVRVTCLRLCSCHKSVFVPGLPVYVCVRVTSLCLCSCH